MIITFELFHFNYLKKSIMSTKLGNVNNGDVPICMEIQKN